MKNLILALSMFMLLLVNGNILAQEANNEQEFQTLFNNKQIVIGGFGGPHVGFSKLDDRSIVLIGGHGGMIINHCLVIGGAGTGIVTPLKYDNIGGENNVYLVGGYGGLYLDFIAFPYKVMHLSFPLVIGGGSMQYVRDINDSNSDFNLVDHDEFFILEPGVDIEINLFKFMRLGAGIKYRWAPNIDLIDTPKDPLNGLSYGITLKFGRF